LRLSASSKGMQFDGHQVSYDTPSELAPSRPTFPRLLLSVRRVTIVAILRGVGSLAPIIFIPHCNRFPQWRVTQLILERLGWSSAQTASGNICSPTRCSHRTTSQGEALRGLWRSASRVVRVVKSGHVDRMGTEFWLGNPCESSQLEGRKW
jgi:hypothetical protein